MNKGGLRIILFFGIMIFFLNFISAPCGNGECGGSETCASCPEDCGPCLRYQCSDEIDNDGDGLIDYPNDPGCSSSTDDDEYNEPIRVISSINQSEYLSFFGVVQLITALFVIVLIYFLFNKKIN
jgi:hypothetical protein